MMVEERDDICGRSVSVLRGVGEARQADLAKIGIVTLGDLLNRYPRAYQNRGDTHTLAEIKDALLRGETGPFSSVLTVSAEPTVRMIRRGMVLLKLRAFDESGSVEITYFNQQYWKDLMHTGAEFRFFGRFTLEGGRLKLNSPIQEAITMDKPLPDIVPVYPLTGRLTQRFMADIVAQALRLAGGELLEYIPREALEELSLPTYAWTIHNIHRPESVSAIETAKRRLVFDELYRMFLSLAKNGTRAKKANTCPMPDGDLADYLASLPFEMTGAQKRSVSEIAADLSGDCLMNRILTGDVGSGKTAVAAAAIYLAVKNGYRAAMMVPTEILAGQHYEDLSALFAPLGIRCALLTGSVKKKEREHILRGLTDEQMGEKIDFVVGTHALISDGVAIERLGLAVIDEQHRFGVMQRAALLEKGQGIHCLVMSATPIPRTLTLAAYGSIDVSRIDELPRGRQAVDTFLVNEGYRERLNAFIRKQTEEGHQVYVVCPAVEESGDKETDPEEMANIPFIDESVGDGSLPIKAAQAHAAYLTEALPGIVVGLVHGKMKPAEKDRVMHAFADGEIQVLVSTTVIEVGVNVPNATLMIVENAERFGLSQLHQLRGRVGRGREKSFVILVSDSTQPEALDRLRAIKGTRDGFAIAEYDLQMRGPGDFFHESGAIRQSGQMEFRLASSCRDTNLIERASYYARRTAEEDPDLRKWENRICRRKLERMGEESGNTMN